MLDLGRGGENRDRVNPALHVASAFARTTATKYESNGRLREDQDEKGE